MSMRRIVIVRRTMSRIFKITCYFLLIVFSNVFKEKSFDSASLCQYIPPWKCSHMALYVIAMLYTIRNGMGLKIIMLLSLSNHQNMYNKLMMRDKNAGRSKFTATAIMTMAKFAYARIFTTGFQYSITVLEYISF